MNGTKKTSATEVAQRDVRMQVSMTVNGGYLAPDVGGTFQSSTSDSSVGSTAKPVRSGKRPGRTHPGIGGTRNPNAVITRPAREFGAYRSLWKISCEGRVGDRKRVVKSVSVARRSAKESRKLAT